MHSKRFGTVIIGGGPAALAPLVSASRDGRLSDVLATGVAIVEKSSSIGAGHLGNYAIHSDSTAFTFLTAVTDHLDPRLNALQDHPIIQELRKAEPHGPIPLTQAAALMDIVGRVLHEAVVASGGVVLVEHEALFAQQSSDGDWLVHVRNCSGGDELCLTASNLVLATGGCQPVTRLMNEDIAGIRLLPTFKDKLIQSDEMLKPAGLSALGQRLAEKDHPRLAIIGGSTSALAAADLLLKQFPDMLRDDASITICHRRPLRIFYRTAEEAIGEGYVDFGPDDICPISSFVYRLAGFRLQSRLLVKRVMGVGEIDRETRVALHRLGSEPARATREVLERADIIVAALGYRPRALRLLDRSGAEIDLQAYQPGRTMVDRECRVIDGDGCPILGVYGIGLAAGFRPTGDLGGEKSFVGQANGLWLWQNAVGSIIVDHLLFEDPADSATTIPVELPLLPPATISESALA